MAHIVHVIEEQAAEDEARCLSVLLGCRSPDPPLHELIVLGRHPAALRTPARIAVRHVPRRNGWLGTLTGPLHRVLRTLAGRDPTMVVHAWGTRAAAAVSAATPPGVAVLTTLADPAKADRPLDWWPTPGTRPGCVNVVGTSRRVRDRLVEAGLAPETIAIIPAVVDEPSARSDRNALRERHGLAGLGPTLLTASSASRAGGQFLAVWAAAILRQLWPTVRILVPGRSAEQRRIARLVGGSFYCPEIVRFVEEQCRPAELLAVADVLVFPAVSDTPTGWMTAAMAASVPVVASEVPCVTEIITDEQTGFLCPAGQPHALAIRIRTALEAERERQQAVDRARTWAERVASPTACARAYHDLYRVLVPTNAPA